MSTSLIVIVTYVLLIVLLNLGSGAETNTLKAICNTFGDYFNVSNVIINLDDKPYTSGHILMKDGDSFKVDTNNSIELK